MKMIIDMFMKFAGKKKIVGIVAAILIAVVGFALGEPSAYIKEAVCDAPVLEVPAVLKEKSSKSKPKK